MQSKLSPNTKVMSISKFTKYFIIAIALICCLDFNAMAADDSFTVVIDAGHGGKDTGAIENSVREKDVNLGVALKLAKILRKKNKDIKVVLTRDKDVFLTLQERADIANKAKADLFISIHANSLDLKNPNRKSIEGASTYTLGLQKDKNNMDVARRENSVIAYESDYNTKYSGFDPNSDESYIIFEMAQKANLAQSVKFAEAVQKQLVNVANRKDRGVKQAGFWVLWATSMPSVLVELDFVTNPKVAEFISSDGGQNKLATAISNATLAYFKALETERKNGRKLRKEAFSETAQTMPDGDGVILANADNSSNRRVSGAPSNDNNPQNVASSRRRRSEKSREKSKNRQYEVAVIQDERDYVVDTPVVEEVITVSQESTYESSTKESKNKNKKNKKKEDKKKSSKGKRVVNGNTVTVASETQIKTSSNSKNAKQIADNKVTRRNQTKQTNQVKQTASNNKRAEAENKKHVKSVKKSDNNVNSAVRLEKKEVVYRIQILASEEHLKSNNPRFCGLSPISCTKNGNLYKYTYGETTDRAEINRMLSIVKKKIPDAFIVTQ